MGRGKTPSSRQDPQATNVPGHPRLAVGPAQPRVTSGCVGGGSHPQTVEDICGSKIPTRQAQGRAGLTPGLFTPDSLASLRSKNRETKAGLGLMVSWAGSEEPGGRLLWKVPLLWNWLGAREREHPGSPSL